MAKGRFSLIKKLAKILLAVLLVCILLNISAKTRQSVNGVVFTKHIPLYAKICGFVERDYEYRALGRAITAGKKGDTEKVMAIFAWVTENIKDIPQGFPKVDDHIWHIVVRGYGSEYQREELFTTLASYAGYEGFAHKLWNKNKDKPIVLSFVKIGNEWHAFDVSQQKSFVDKSKDLSYGEYLDNMDKAMFKNFIRRPDKQKIPQRIVYEIRRLFDPSIREDDNGEMSE